MKSFPTNFRNKTRMSSFTTSIQYSIRVPAAALRQEREIKGIQIGKEDVKLSLFGNYMVVYIENPIDSTKKLLNLINEFGKIAGYKVNIQKSKAFWDTNNDISERENRKKIPFDIATGKIKYLEINLTKEVKDLYSEKYT